MRSQSTVALGFILLAFGMLWIPLGQHEFLIPHWMKVGFFMAPFLLFIACANRMGSSDRFRLDASFISLLLLVAYIVHQFEEHWIDLHGNYYAFKPYLNGLIRERLGFDGNSEGPLSDAGVFVINTSLVWLVAALAIWRASEHIFPALCLTSIVVVNAFSHVGAAVMTFGYNPGLLTAILIFLPFGLATYFWSLRSGAGSPKEVTASLLWGVLGHVIMIAGMIASGGFRLIPELVYFALLVGWSLLPVFLFRQRKA